VPGEVVGLVRDYAAQVEASPRPFLAALTAEHRGEPSDEHSHDLRCGMSRLPSRSTLRSEGDAMFRLILARAAKASPAQ
jgi:hypothetical protein